MKAAIYCRVSTEDQETLNQRIALDEYCKRNNIEVYNYYEDKGVSGSKTTRPALDKMLQDMRDGYFQVIVVWKLDRLGRSLQHLLGILSELERKDVRLVITEMAMDTGTPHGKLFFSIAGAFAEFERELIRERINLGLTRAKKQGQKLGRPTGSKDKKERRRSGYWLRWSSKQTPPKKIESIALIEIPDKIKT